MSETIERRQHARVKPKGTVVIATGDQRQRGRIVNIGIGGMLAGTSITMPERLLGRATELDLRLDDRDAQWFRLTGKIARIKPEHVAIVFEAVPPKFVRLIDDVASATHVNRRRISVVLIDATEARRSSIASGFRDTGCTVLEAATALEAIVRLGEASFEPDLIAIADSIPAQTSIDIREFVEREHPNAKLVVIGDTVLDPGGAVHWISSADPDSDLAARVRQVLTRPTRR